MRDYGLRKMLRKFIYKGKEMEPEVRLQNLINYDLEGLSGEEPSNVNHDLSAVIEDIIDLRAELADKDNTIKHLKGKAEFDMPVNMQGLYSNACTDSCDMIEDSKRMDSIYPDLRIKSRKLRNIEGVLKLWASVINPDYKKIYIQIQQILKGE